MKTNIDDKCNWRSCISYLFIFTIPISLVIYCLCINNEDCFCEFDCKLGGDGCYPPVVDALLVRMWKVVNAAMI